ncbi:sulfite exporter TauE/SafE family protein [Cohnella zeiphila]|uniref:Sulfite exporter TauE/SafE family protein n=1 Tax=Cohnella zeiphila TaxID=2761120 RepID=A0A7X0VXL4_9BACL|nr:sulfite exporter TauE/SafE family protein [Cohnella zeiphila]MBB6733567.1 sulfite exporter TauE/SafE family protein [Cohnella zeiphila]
MTLSPDSLLLAALAGLAGAPHCIVMCGGIVSSFALQEPAAPHKPVLAYTAGKNVTYALVGGFMGGVGSFLNYAGGLVGLQGIACFVGGMFLLMWALGKYTLPTQRLSPLRIPWVEKRLSGLRRRHERTAMFATGLALGFIPCGLTYAMQMQAASSGSWLSGFLLLLVFGICTVPALILVGVFAGRLGKSWRRGLRRASFVLAVTMGVLSIMKGLSANGIVPSIHPWLW